MLLCQSIWGATKAVFIRDAQQKQKGGKLPGQDLTEKIRKRTTEQIQEKQEEGNTIAENLTGPNSSKMRLTKGKVTNKQQQKGKANITTDRGFLKYNQFSSPR